MRSRKIRAACFCALDGGAFVDQEIAETMRCTDRCGRCFRRTRKNKLAGRRLSIEPPALMAGQSKAILASPS